MGDERKREEAMGDILPIDEGDPLTPRSAAPAATQSGDERGRRRS
jgi:hypothetical protein